MLKGIAISIGALVALAVAAAAGPLLMEAYGSGG